MIATKQFSVSTNGFCDVINITDEVKKIVQGNYGRLIGHEAIFRELA